MNLAFLMGMDKSIRKSLKMYVCFFLISSLFSTDAYCNSLRPEFRLAVEESSLLLQRNPINFDKDPYGDLKPLPEAKVILAEVLQYLNSAALLNLVDQSQALKLMREGLFTSIFHLNLKPEVVEKNRPEYAFIDNAYPYEPVYDKPFPKRPTLEFFSEVLDFIQAVDALPSSDRAASSELKIKIESFQPLKDFQKELRQRTRSAVANAAVRQFVLTQSELVKNPVDSYLILRARLSIFGEVAPMPEFAHAVNQVLNRLKEDIEIQKITERDPAFRVEVQNAIAALEQLSHSSSETLVHAKSTQPFPYRQTIAAIERAINIFDIRDRIKFPESENWYEVEDSWHKKDSDGKIKPKLLPLYHFNRYKYQQFGLLANPDVIVFPWAASLSELDLIKNRPVPLGLIGVNLETQRADRHYNSPKDFWYHDINHVRRMWGYDKKLSQQKGIRSWSQLITEFRNRERFVNNILAQTEPSFGASEQEVNLRRMERELVFETLHETALPAERASLLNDIFRYEAVRQPFERFVQQENQTELVRTFDGNVQSGADRLKSQFNLDQPTTVRYYWDRAPNYLANVDNKGRWGFHGSTFQQRQDPYYGKFYQPEKVAEAARSLLSKIHFKNGENGKSVPDMSLLITAAKAQDGQPELWNYYALNLNEDQSKQGKELMVQRQVPHSWSSESNQALGIKKNNPHISPEEIADRVYIDRDKKEILRWMAADLENYLNNFEKLFAQKLARIEEHHRQRYADMKKWLAPLQDRLKQEPQNTTLKQEIDRLKAELKPHALVVQYSNAQDFMRKFVGASGKILQSKPDDLQVKMMDKSGLKKLYVDSWSVPFFNSGTQTIEMARNGTQKALEEFKKINLDGPISYRKFTELVALFARPEFDDIRRFKLKPFPTSNEKTRFGSERNDAMYASRKFPFEIFSYTNRQVDLDPLSASFGTGEHFVGLASHSEVNRADGRIFTGPADFLEHDYAHAFFNFSDSIPGSPKDWKQIHEDFFYRLNKEPDHKKRKMMSLVYFHLTHESGYKRLSLTPENQQSNEADLKNILSEIKEKMKIRYYYDWVLEIKEFNGQHEKILDGAFWEVAKLFKSNYQKVASTYKAIAVKSLRPTVSSKKEQIVRTSHVRCVDFFRANRTQIK